MNTHVKNSLKTVSHIYTSNGYMSRYVTQPLCVQLHFPGIMYVHVRVHVTAVTLLHELDVTLYGLKPIRGFPILHILKNNKCRECNKLL